MSSDVDKLRNLMFQYRTHHSSMWCRFVEDIGAGLGVWAYELFGMLYHLPEQERLDAMRNLPTSPDEDAHFGTLYKITVDDLRRIGVDVDAAVQAYMELLLERDDEL